MDGGGGEAACFCLQNLTVTYEVTHALAYYVPSCRIYPEPRGGSYLGACSPVCDRGQAVKVNFLAWSSSQAKNLGLFGTVKVASSAQWAWLLLVGQGSRPDFRCGQGVKQNFGGSRS